MYRILGKGCSNIWQGVFTWEAKFILFIQRQPMHLLTLEHKSNSILIRLTPSVDEKGVALQSADPWVDKRTLSPVKLRIT